MKIALFHDLPSGGAKRFTLGEVRRLAQRGHDIVEFAPSTAELSYCSFAPYVRRQRVFELTPAAQTKQRLPFLTPYLHAVQGIITLQRVSRMSKIAAAEIDAGDFDITFAVDSRLTGNPYVLQYLRTPSVLQLHHVPRLRSEQRQAADSVARSSRPRLARLKDLYYRPARWLFENMMHGGETRSARAAHLMLTNSEFSKQRIFESYGVQSHVVYPGIDVDAFRPLQVSEGDYVLSVGALLYNKGYRFLVSALGHLDVSRRPRLLVAANSIDPDEATLVHRMAAEAGVDLEIRQVFDDDELARIYGQAKVLVYAPIAEALGLAPLEAMACGTPVVAVGDGGVRETVPDGVAGWLVPRDIGEFSAKLDMLLSDDGMRLSMGRAGIEYVRANWDWERSVDLLEEHLGSALNRRTVSPGLPPPAHSPLFEQNGTSCI